jgi:hypothetical protein
VRSLTQVVSRTESEVAVPVGVRLGVGKRGTDGNDEAEGEEEDLAGDPLAPGRLPPEMEQAASWTNDIATRLNRVLLVAMPHGRPERQRPKSGTDPIPRQR